MPLKSLELVGYKTFASKSYFEFSDTITAIVGPNGSGKSNIADSLRWVLGEQAYSLLRGKKTIDMIFSGSQQRPRAGMASASVTFDNSDGWLPIDFSEVNITRRAYRDGQNEYLINNQKVRLKDISELLARSGLAERTYTIIGQGLVDAALSLKAEERRKLFEEAAGIGIYRARREEALRRLETTRRNLERVRDILAELRPRLRSLERQAKRAQEHEQIKTDLHVLLREWYGYHWHRQQNDLNEARSTARTQEEILSAARARQSGFESQINVVRERVHQLRANLNSWHRELSSLHNKRERISRELAVAQERQRSLAERFESYRSEKIRLTEENRLHVERLQRAREETARFEKLAEEARNQNQVAQDSLSAKESRRASILEAVQFAEKQFSELLSTATRETARLEELENRKNSFEATSLEFKKNLQHTENAVTKAQTEFSTVEQRVNTATKNRNDATNKLEAFRVKLDTLKVKISNLEREQNSQITEKAKLETRLEVLQQAELALAGYSGGSRLLLNAAKSQRLSGVIAALSTQIEAPPDFEAAVASALGQFLDAIILDTDRNAGASLDLLLQENSNGAVIPLERLHPQPVVKAPNDSGVIGTLSTMVKCPVELRPVIDMLLGQVILVKTRNDVKSVITKLPREVRIVTVDGEIFHPGGGITTGGKSTSGIISRSRRQKEIRNDLEHLNNMLAKNEAELQSLANQLEKEYTTEQKLQAEVEIARTEEDDIQNDLRRAQTALDKVVNQKNWQDSQLSNQRVELKTTHELIENTRLGLEKTNGVIETSQAKVHQLQSELREMQLSELQAQASHWQTQLAVAERAAEDALSREYDRNQMLADARHRLVELDAQLSNLQSETSEISSEQTMLKNEEAEIQSQISKARTLIDPAEEELRRIEAEQDAVQETESKARHAATIAERNHSQAQITLARKQEALDSLKTRIEDDFGLVAFEYVDEIAGPTPLPLGNLVETLPLVNDIAEGLGNSIKRQRAQLRRMGAINPDAQKEYEEVRERFNFMTDQIEDLMGAEADILETVNELDLLMEREFRKTFDEVAREFRETFTRLFGGGSARLVLSNPEDMTNTGVDIEASLPGRRAQGLSLLSGGERSLTACALVFSLIKVSPTPFCVLDEVDAMLDEANVNRFADLLAELSERTQFIVITHNRNTVQAAETIYGITMGRDSTSQVLGLRMDEVADLVK